VGFGDSQSQTNSWHKVKELYESELANASKSFFIPRPKRPNYGRASRAKLMELSSTYYTILASREHGGRSSGYRRRLY